MRHTLAVSLALPVAFGLGLTAAKGSVNTTPTQDPAALAAALHPTNLTINSVIIKNGMPGQFGTFTGFSLPPVTIHDGVVLSSGDVTNLGPIPGATDPTYDPASPPPQVNNQMNPEPAAGGTPEFDAYGSQSNNIQNFNASYDVAALEVHFTLPVASQVQFDFIFGSVEFPFYTSSFTDAFLVFLDGTSPSHQVTFDLNNNPVQVGSSFAGLETTADVNTAFSNPHALIHHLTTTTTSLPAGAHTLIFEVGDVNDHILDSAVFISSLRALPGGTTPPGTNPSDDCRADFDGNGSVAVADIFAFLRAWFDHESDANFDGANGVQVNDIFAFLTAWFRGC